MGEGPAGDGIERSVEGFRKGDKASFFETSYARHMA